MSASEGALGKLFKGAGIIFVGTVIARALALGAEVAIVRALKPEVFGTIAVAYTVSLIISRLSLLGVPQGVTRFMSDSDLDVDYHALVLYGLLIVVPVALAASLCVFLLRKQISLLINNPGIPEYLWIFSAFIVIFPIGQIFIAVLRAKERPTQAVISKDLYPRLLGFLIFSAFVIIGMEQVGAVTYWVSLPVITTLVSLHFLRRELNFTRIFRTSIDWNLVRELWSFSWPLAVGTSFILLFNYMDVLMIEYFLQPSDVGYYRAVKPLHQITRIVLSSFTFLYLPLATTYFSKNQFEELDQFYKTVTKWATILTLPMVLVFAVFSRDVVLTFFGPTYLPAAGVLTVLVSGLFYTVLVGPNGSTAKAINRSRIESTSAAGGLTVNFFLNVLLIPSLGIIGAAAATVAGYLVYNSLEVYLIYRSVGSLPFSTNQLKPLVPTTIVAIIVHIVVPWDFGLFGLIGIGVFLFGVSFVSLVGTNSLDESDIMLLTQAEDKFGMKIPHVRKFIRYMERK